MTSPALASPARGIGSRPPVAVPPAHAPAAAVPEPAQQRPTMVGSSRRVLRTLQALTVFLVFGQRLALPFGASYISFSLVVVFAMAVVLYRAGVLVEDRRRTLWYVAAMSLCLVTGLVELVAGRPDTSVTSLLLLVVIYAPFCLVLRADLRPYYLPVLRTYCRCLVIIAAITVAQFAAQLVGIWTYSDLFAAVVPHQLVVTGYTTAYPIQFGSSLVKANGIFCLEPSFCSQLLAFAMIAQLVLGEKRWRLVLYAVALVATVSGTGVLLLGAGLAGQMVRRGGRWTVRVLLVAAVGVGLAALTPPGQVAISRTTEVDYTASSGNQRLVAPYIRTWDDLSNGGLRAVVFGEGPGFADREAQQINVQTGLPAISPPISKLLTEYGLFAGLVTIAALVAFLTLGTPSVTLSVALLVFYFFLSSSLLQGQTVYLSWLLVSVFGNRLPRVAPSRRHAIATASRPQVRRLPAPV